jgi:hypothetical protein
MQQMLSIGDDGIELALMQKPGQAIMVLEPTADPITLISGDQFSRTDTSSSSLWIMLEGWSRFNIARPRPRR